MVLLAMVLWHEHYPLFTEGVVKIVAPIGTIGAVVFALFGDLLRAWSNPVQVQIEVLRPDEINRDWDKTTIEKRVQKVYCHHLRVTNRTPAEPLVNCRVWLRSVSVRKPSEAPSQVLLAVPPLMEWAPSEYSRDKRTFCKQQVFDLGKIFEEDGSFQLTIYSEMGAAIGKLKRHPPGEALEVVLFATADNYLVEEDFTFEIRPQPQAGEKPIPAVITRVN